MRRLAILIPLLAIGLGPSPATSQSDAPRLYMSYFKVDFTDMPAWIESYQENDVPLLEAMVDEGLILGFGMWAHDTGGEYNLVSVVATADWNALGDFYDGYFSRIPPEAMTTTMPMIRKHTDEIWVIAHPRTGNDTGTVVYESAWSVDFDQLEAWEADFERYTQPVLEQAVEDGLITDWARLTHDTGGPWNVKYHYWLNDWDDADELIQRIVEGQSQRDPDAMRAARAHEDHIWRVVPRTPGG
ncbi:MAG: hypothetical protein P8188_14020 [Gemmatimonadota bacterium]